MRGERFLNALGCWAAKNWGKWWFILPSQVWVKGVGGYIVLREREEYTPWVGLNDVGGSAWDPKHQELAMHVGRLEVYLYTRKAGYTDLGRTHPLRLRVGRSPLLAIG